MPTWIYRPHHPSANENGMVDKALIPIEYNDPHVHIIRDTMPETRHMATGKIHTSKSEFRKDTKVSGCVEVGNDSSIMDPRPRKMVTLDRVERRNDIKRAIHELRNGNRNAIWRE